MAISGNEALLSYLTIRTTAPGRDFLCGFTVNQTNASQDLLGEFVVRHLTAVANELDASFSARRSSTGEILGAFIVQHPDSGELLGELIVRQPGSAELLGTLSISKDQWISQGVPVAVYRDLTVIS